jgi:hexosaminidase
MRKLLLFILCLGQTLQAQHLLPKPEVYLERSGSFVWNAQTTLWVPNTEVERICAGLEQRVYQISGLRLSRANAVSRNQIQFLWDYSLLGEAYTLAVSPDGITIKAGTVAGFFYATQTLLQYLPAGPVDGKLALREVWIKDTPRFEHRGIMLDVARHFFSIEEIKGLLDVMGSLKLNRFHWHLTDDQGWRIQILKYPKLTEVGAYRMEEGRRYGGFYTQEQIREVVKYAAERYITVIPEIEMPGHAMAALSAYPELGCTGGPYQVRTEWGVEDHIFCPTEETFSFLEGVLEEVMDLFPSPYIHIGGDEVPKVTWKNSAYAQELMRREGLKDEEALQSYFIKRIDAFVSKKGRKIIGWDEILEGGLSPNAAVMSWRGEEGGVRAAKLGHPVIMSPTSHLYLDYYQGPRETEPEANGIYVPLEKVYSYDPIPVALQGEERKQVLGVQGNLWTEYIKDWKQVEYMLFPRALALAEIAWYGGEKNYEEFVKRVHGVLERMPSIHASTAYLNPEFSLVRNSKGLMEVRLSRSASIGNLQYIIKGEKKPYSGPIVLQKSETLGALVVDADGKALSKERTQSFRIAKSTGLEYNFGKTPTRQSMKPVLTDGQRAQVNDWSSWVGFEGDNAEVLFDLKKKQRISSVSVGYLQDRNSWILSPKGVEIYTSKDGKSFTLLAVREHRGHSVTEVGSGEVLVEMPAAKTRYVKVRVRNGGVWPKGHPAEGAATWIFLDEISID